MSRRRRLPHVPRRQLVVEDFDYGSLATHVQDEIRAEATAIRELITKTAENVITIGMRLLAARERIGRAHFQQWLRTEFQWSQPVASNYMRVAKLFASVDCIAHFQPGALYVLARKKVTPGSLEHALSLARQGEFITTARAHAIVESQAPAESKHNERLVRRLRQSIQKIVHSVEQKDREAIADELQELADMVRESMPESDVQEPLTDE